MKFTGAILCFFGFILALSIVSASTYTLEYFQVGDKLVIRQSIDGAEGESIVSNEKLEKGAKGYYFVEKIMFNESYDSAEIRFNLDYGFIIEKDNVFPADYTTETDGQTITLVWRLGRVEKGGVFPVFASIVNTNEAYTAFWIAAIVILLLVIAYFRYNRQGRKIKITTSTKRITKAKVKTEERYEHLLDTEKKVIELLKGADRHELWQKQVQDATGFSKAKISRLVRNLEARALVVKIPFGNTNKIRLK